MSGTVAAWESPSVFKGDSMRAAYDYERRRILVRKIYPLRALSENEYLKNLRVKDIAHPLTKRLVLSVECGNVKVSERATGSQKPGSNSFQIFVKSLTGWTHTFEVVPHETVGALKRRMQDRELCDARMARLLYSGIELEDNEETMGYYGIAKESTIHLVYRLRGGMMHESSGRDDYDNSPQSPTLRVLNVAYALGGGDVLCRRLQTITLRIEEGSTPEHVRHVFEMETNTSYFNTLSAHSLIECYAYETRIQRLSPMAQRRLQQAVAGAYA